ncbi:DNA-binding death effector domain-containing protein 2-like [Huso huso]|uniref:DNA-binding death effector domain-containing protein 2-like n=1 Tax=Huso huso TaxID=61971 RepID=A0ABR0YBD5_HUSHU
MAAAGTRRLAISQCWEEAACLSFYGMQSLHEIFEVVGSHLTDSDLEVLSFLLDETYLATHPLDPAGWAVDLEGRAGATCPRLQAAMQRYHGRRGSSTGELGFCAAGVHKPKDGVELLLELERRGVCDESNLTHLLQLLRILTRHDLMPFVTQKKRRTVSPERCSYGSVISGAEEEEEEGVRKSAAETDGAGRGQWRAGVDPNRQSPAGSKRPRGRKRRSRKLNSPPRRAGGGGGGGRGGGQGQQHIFAQDRVTCGKRPLFASLPPSSRCFSLHTAFSIYTSHLNIFSPSLLSSPPSLLSLSLSLPRRAPACARGILRSRDGSARGRVLQQAGPRGAAVRSLQPGRRADPLAGPRRHRVRHQVLGPVVPGRLLEGLPERRAARGPERRLHHRLAPQGSGKGGRGAAGQRG